MQIISQIKGLNWNSRPILQPLKGCREGGRPWGKDTNTDMPGLLCLCSLNWTSCPSLGFSSSIYITGFLEVSFTYTSHIPAFELSLPSAWNSLPSPWTLLRPVQGIFARRPTTTIFFSTLGAQAATQHTLHLLLSFPTHHSLLTHSYLLPWPVVTVHLPIWAGSHMRAGTFVFFTDGSQGHRTAVSVQQLWMNEWMN